MKWSDKPLIGPLAAWTWRTWHGFSLRLAARRRSSKQQMRADLAELDARLIDLDRDLTALTRQVAELTYQFIRLERRLDALAGRDAETEQE